MAQYFTAFSVLVCCFWYLVTCFAITRIPFFARSGLNKWWLLVLFSLKIVAGFAYGIFYMQPALVATSDTWRYFDLSKAETDWLLRDPLAFFTDLFNYGYNRAGNLFLGENSYWNDLKSNVIIKLIAIANVFTFKNYFANIFLFNFLFFYGPVALYRLLQQVLNVNKWLVVFAVFLMPSFLFWCSGVHKDGIIFTCCSLMAYYAYLQLKQKKVSFTSLAVMLIAFVVVFSLRNFMVLLLLPSLVLWTLVLCKPKQAFLWLSTIYGIGVLLFFLSGKLSASTDMLQYVIAKQNEFKQLSGASVIDVPPLENNVASFLHFFPSAIDIGFFRPHAGEVRNLSYIPSVVEIILLWLVVAVALVAGRKLSLKPAERAYVFFALSYAVAILVLAGYTITFSGAIVRYRAVVLPFLVTGFLPWLNVLLKLVQEKITGKSATAV